MCKNFIDYLFFEFIFKGGADILDFFLLDFFSPRVFFSRIFLETLRYLRNASSEVREIRDALSPQALRPQQ